MKLLTKSIGLTYLFLLILFLSSCEKQDPQIDDIAIDQDLKVATAVILDPGTIHQINYLNSLIEDIEELAEDGTLNKGQANSLIVKIENSIKSLEQGNYNAAENKLDAFNNEVVDFVENALIPEEIGEVIFIKVDIWMVMIQSDVVYSYLGNNFNLFTCVDSYLCPDPDPLYTSYSTSDFVTAVITLSEPLPGNLNLEDIRGLPGFTLTMTDGHQVMTLDPGVPGEAFVSTDANGNIIAPWSVFVNCCPYPNNNIFTLNWPGVRGVADGGYLTNATGLYPDTPRDGGMVYPSPGKWATDINTP
jgi:hypothetical protein